MNKRFVDFYMDVAKRTAQLSRAVRLQVGSIIVKDDRIISIGYNGMPSGWDNNCENVELMDGQECSSPDEITKLWPYEGKFWIQGEQVDTRYRLKTKPEVLHAESNAIAKLARSSESGEGATMFVTHAPCIDCAKLIYQSGISTVYYQTAYRCDDGIDFLKKCGITVEQTNV